MTSSRKKLSQSHAKDISSKGTLIKSSPTCPPNVGREKLQDISTEELREAEFLQQFLLSKLLPLPTALIYIEHVLSPAYVEESKRSPTFLNDSLLHYPEWKLLVNHGFLRPTEWMTFASTVVPPKHKKTGPRPPEVFCSFLVAKKKASSHALMPEDVLKDANLLCAACGLPTPGGSDSLRHFIYHLADLATDETIGLREFIGIHEWWMPWDYSSIIGPTDLPNEQKARCLYFQHLPRAAYEAIAWHARQFSLSTDLFSDVHCWYALSTELRQRRSSHLALSKSDMNTLRALERACNANNSGVSAEKIAEHATPTKLIDQGTSVCERTIGDCLRKTLKPNGLADHSKKRKGWRITQKGMDLLKSKN